MNIPIIIICYNNSHYVKNTLSQILKINKEYYKNIQILNNASTCLTTINFLNSCDVKVIHNSSNIGPWINNWKNKWVYDNLPEKFILTDPDLKLNENIPNNFIEIFSELSDKYQTSKIGFSLDISDFDKMYKTLNYSNTGKTIYDWESQFYQNKINDDIYELYDASIDTTFCLVNKKYEYNDYNVRIAGNFTAKHLPWYIENEIYNIYENYKRSINANTISSISKTIKEDIENNCLKIYKNNEMFFIKNNECNQNLSFWKNTYSIWETETFEIFDKHLSQDKIFIDIGGWIGTTAMYGSRKSKHVYSIEADNQSCHDLMINLKSNCVENYTVINKAIFNVDNLKIMFGKNVHLSNSKLNDSTSHIYDNVVIQNDCYLVKTITLEKIIQTYQINIPEISLIKVDIEGGEENILNDLFDMRIKHNISLYIRFHYSWWKDKNLDRFVFLSENVKNRIIHYPFISIFF